MYQVGDIIIYSCEGACRVESIEKLDVSGIDHEKLYYNLSPVYHMGNIFVPLDTKMFMRPVIKPEDARNLINLIPTIKVNLVVSMSRRSLEELYNDHIQTHDCTDLIRVLKIVHVKGIAAAKDRKKLGAIDERFRKKAEDLLFGELALVLSMSKDDVKSYVVNKIQETGIIETAAV
jgi:CarD family transcriptional regulator